MLTINGLKMFYLKKLKKVYKSMYFLDIKLLFMSMLQRA